MDQAMDLSAGVGFAVNPLDRLSDQREDAAKMQALLADPDARTLLLAGEAPLMTSVGDPLFSLAEAGDIGALGERVFLGLGPRGPLFACRIETYNPDDMQGPGLTTVDLRTIAVRGLVPPDLVGALGQAKSVLHWHARHRFCAHCGAPTRMTASGWRRECDACKTQHFPRTDPVVIMLTTRGEDCLLGRQARFPPGMYSCLAGFLEPGETIEDAVRRELYEEAGVRAGAVRYLASQPWPFPASLMIGCLAEVAAPELKVDHEELEDARWFTRDECRAILAGAHGGGVTCPPPMAIANFLMRQWAQ